MRPRTRRLSPGHGPRWVVVLLTAASGATLATGCAAPTPNPPASATANPGGRTLAISAAFYPLAEAAARVGGSHVTVTNLTPPGSEPHDVELTGEQVTELGRADAVVYLSAGFQPVVENAAATLPQAVAKIDVLAGMPVLTARGATDPHVWVDPARQARIAITISDALIGLDPANADDFAANRATYLGELGSLDAAFTSGLKACASKAIVTSHRAFAYLTDHYGLQQISVAGASPSEEPDPQAMQAVAADARKHDVRVVFYESNVAPKLAETIAREIGATTDALDPVETITAADLAQGASYVTVQRKNLSALTRALGCTP